ncbi:hypothetical protein swp_3425 [Shewanella piezotolerans WP3]|uniref:DUF6916 domain-containing protein n=1 Tax=Shewanella piezotolerans (strain WP3 / JCM 13877) TaxID=225849 RepID=B8CRW6_SHEPW|nr:hypothetical protein [Shewanella piezotolerans]ACJ30124.1 hypothetical protein swp_3425 [Shewanella piezotolerans WP3]
MKPFTFENIKSLVGEQFVIKDQLGNQLPVSLTHITESKRESTTSFSAIFEFVAGGLLEDGGYYVEHPKIEKSYLCLSLNSSTEFEILVSSLKA